MLLGIGVVTLTILVPALGTEDETSTWIEYLCYSFFWSMMLTSHARTMCADPGFIPLDYSYKEEVLVAPFKSFADMESASKTFKKKSSPTAKRGDEENKLFDSQADEE